MTATSRLRRPAHVPRGPWNTAIGRRNRRENRHRLWSASASHRATSDARGAARPRTASVLGRQNYRCCRALAQRNTRSRSRSPWPAARVVVCPLSSRRTTAAARRRHLPRHTTPGRSLHVHVHAAAGLRSVLEAFVRHLPDLHERVVECGHDEWLAHLALHVLDVGAQRALRSQRCLGELAALSFSGELLAQG